MLFCLLMEIDGTRITCWHADLALGALQEQTLGRIHHTHCGNSLWEGQMDALDGCKPRIVVVGDSHGTIFGTDSATGTLVRIHVTGLLNQINREIARFTPNSIDFRVRQD